jgi:hypothetical protein
MYMKYIDISDGLHNNLKFLILPQIRTVDF